MTVKVYDNKTKNERTMPEKAYLLLKNRMTFISYQDEDGNEVEGTPQGLVVQKKSVKEDAPPAESKIVVRTPQDIAAKKAELEALNQAAIQKAAEKEQPKEQPVKVRQKPGPKPKINAQV